MLPTSVRPKRSAGDFEHVANSIRVSNAPRLNSKAKSEVIQLKDANDSDQPEIERLGLSSYDMWALGVSIVIGGQYFAWNEGLHAGFGSLLIATILVASGYVCLVLCIAELSSALPFAGGSYGIARVTLGFYPGYLVAYMDCGESIVYVAVATFLLGQMITAVSGTSEALEPVYWVVFLVTSLGIHGSGGLAFWWINRAVTVSSLLIVLMYILGSAKDADFHEYALMDASTATGAWFRGGMYEFMRILPLPCWFFVGVESINLACKDMATPKTSVPPGYLACMGTLFATAFALLFTCCAQYPGVDRLKDELNPLNYGFARMFAISFRQATALSLPATYATASGFMFCFGRQLRAMGQSGLASHFLGDTLPGWSTPVYALVGGSCISLATCFLMQSSEWARMLCALASYGTQFASFVVLRNKYAATIKREFVSPLGMVGAAYGFAVFSFIFIAICGFQKNFIAMITFVVFLVIVSVYYVLVAGRRQFFSEEEKEVMFKAYVLKSNTARATRMRKGRSLSARLIHAQGSGAHPRPQQSSHSSKPFSGRRPSRILPGASAERSASLITVTRAFSQQHPENRLNRHSTLGAGESEHSDMDSLDLSDPEVGAGAGGAYFSTEESLCADHWPPGGGRKSKTELGIITEVITEDVADIGQMNSYDFNP